MLSDQLRQLLTAYVDGELSNRQRKAVLRLLRRSPEARALLRKLQEDSVRLRRLPRPRLGPDFTARVVLAVHRQATRPPRERTIPLWKGAAAAAALFLGVGSGSYLFFYHHLAPPSEVAVVPSPPDEPVPPRPAPERGGPTVVDSGTKPPPPVPPGPERLDVMPDAVVERPPTPPPVTPAGTAEKPVLTDMVPALEMFQKPRVAQVPVFPLMDVRNLEAARLAKELQKAPAFRIELPCNESSRAFRRVEAALKEAGTTLVIDQAAQNRLRQPRWRSNFVFYLEDITSDELARVLARIGAEDRKAAEARPRPDGQFTKLVLDPLSEADRKEMLDLFRHDTRPLTAPAKSASKERLALAATYNPERPRPGSPEVKRYFESRKPLRPGALQVLIVLRETAP